MTAVLASLAAGMRDARGWRRRLLGFGFGALATLALSPVNIFPVLIVSFSALVWLMDGVSSRRGAFALGWWFGFGYFSAGLYWTGFALFVEADKYAWLLPFAVFGLPAVLAVFSGLGVLAAWMTGRRGVPGVIALAVAWTAVEWLRGHVLTGFPWNLVGYAWADWGPVVQLASTIGIHGLGLLTVFGAALPATLAETGPNIPAMRRWTPMALMLAAFAAIWVTGSQRLAGHPTVMVENVRLRLVQPAIDQAHKWRQDMRLKNLKLALDLTKSEGFGSVSHVVWAETAAPFFLGREPKLRRILGQATPPGGLLITGAPRTTAEREDQFRVWNSVHALNPEGEIVATYDKFHLVPFGEYVPLRGLLGPLGLERLTAGRGDFQAGPGPRTLDLPGLPPVSPLICYEVIFAADVASDRSRPGWLLNLTNDGWFGLSAGPHQHFAAARVRAVEEGLALVRVANTGISGIVDPVGRVTSKLGLGIRGVLDGELPRALRHATVYARFGDWTAALLMLLLTGAALIRKRRGPET